MMLEGADKATCEKLVGICWQRSTSSDRKEKNDYVYF